MPNYGQSYQSILSPPDLANIPGIWKKLWAMLRYGFLWAMVIAGERFGVGVVRFCGTVAAVGLVGLLILIRETANALGLW